MKNYAFYRELHRRGMGTKQLADAIGLRTHSHVCKVLNGTAGRGKWTRRRLAPLLTETERALLGWDEQGNLVPQGTMCQSAQTTKTNGEKP